MSDITRGDVTGTQGSGSGGTAETAKSEAREVASTAGDEAGRVATTAKQEATSVAREAKSQARDLYHQTQGELRDQAAHQQERVASGLRALADQLGSMADGADQQGVAADLVRQASAKAGQVGHWLGDRDPGSLLTEVKSFARRKPGIFIGAAALAGLAAGRLTRALAQGAPSAGESVGQSTTASRPTSTTAPSPGATAAPAGGVSSSAGYAPPPLPPVGGGQVPPTGVSPVYDRTEAAHGGAPFTEGSGDDRRDTV